MMLGDASVFDLELILNAISPKVEFLVRIYEMFTCLCLARSSTKDSADVVLSYSQSQVDLYFGIRDIRRACQALRVGQPC